MEREDLELVVALIEARAVIGAGARLGLSQPVVTRRLQKLEEELGTTLLSRRTRPAKPTSEGLRAYKESKKILRQLNELTASFQQDAVIDGELRLGTALALGDDLLEHPIECLRRDFPHLSLQIIASESNDLVARLGHRNLDVAVVLAPINFTVPDPFISEVIESQEGVIVASKELMLPQKLTLRELAGQRWVLNPSGCCGRDAVRNELERQELPFHIAAESTSLSLRFELVKKGMGIGLFPEHFVRMHWQRSGLQKLSVPELKLRYEVVLIWHSDSAHQKAPLASVKMALQRFFRR
jgi:DNA-binding transcriptional LysR family regulator